MRLILLMILASLLLGACGQKGPLYKTPEPQTNQSEPVSATSPLSPKQTLSKEPQSSQPVIN